MKKFISFIICFITSFLLIGCGKPETLLSNKNPVTLSLWHVYGEQANSPFNRLVDEFNLTEGKQKGIIINVTSMTDSVKIGDELKASFNHEPNALPMPDIFFCHKSNANMIGAENLVNFKDYFTNYELNAYIPEFLDDGIIDDKLVIFPVSKSTHLLYLNGTRFEKFAKDMKVSYDDLATWDGYFDVAGKYYTWSGGQPFGAIDFPFRQLEIFTMKYDPFFMTKNNWYDFNNLNLKKCWEYFIENVINGHVVISDKFFNTQIMTGEVVSGIGSSAAILYCNDTVTYPDNTTEPTNLKVLPLPQAGVGLCALKTTEQKAEAVTVFTKWLVDSKRNLDFVVKTGYMPVHKGSFENIKDYEFVNDAYKNLYMALLKTKETCIAVPECQDLNYYSHLNRAMVLLKENQKPYQERYRNGENMNDLISESWELIKNANKSKLR